jgi:hypothetical protein
MAEQERRQRLVGVFRDAAHAQDAVERVQSVGHHAVRVGDPDDHVAALRGEMHEELTRSFFAPHAGLLLTKESGRAMGVSIAVFSALFAVAALPLATFEMADLGVGPRVGLVLIVGALAGATVGFVVGNALGARGPATSNAADAGVVVSVDDPTEAAERAMVESGPTRLDVIDEAGLPIETVTTEDDRSSDGVFERLGHALTQPAGGEPEEWADVSTHRGRGSERRDPPAPASPS